MGNTAEGLSGHVLEGQLSPANAHAARALMPSLRPVPMGLRTSMGTGDRLGVATVGHIRAFRAYGRGIEPVFAQQSMREMDRLGRTPQQVMDAATFGCIEAGWTGIFGADADHLKTIAEIDRALEAGFTTFTLDPGEHVVAVADGVTDETLEALPWGDLEDTIGAMLNRYRGLVLDLDQIALVAHDAGIRRAAAKYARAVVHTVAMYRHLVATANYDTEVEISVDETDEATTLIEHVYLATELKRLGVEWVGFAPRYIGDFEKGVEYIGDVTELAGSLAHHARIAEHFGGYKISLHSGSDKFSIYRAAAEATKGVMHLKTSGTSYLVALEVAARFDPALFWEAYDVSREAYRQARSSYQVSAELSRAAPAARGHEERPIDVLNQFDSRQILHVGYAAVLREEQAGRPSGLSIRLSSLLADRGDEYAAALEDHIGRHLSPIVAALR
nr:tagaturonate epimerase family protein [Cryobacterium levicorallinum]